MDNNLKLVGGGLAGVMLLGGISLGSSIPSDREIAEEVMSALKPVTDSVAGLEGRLGDITGEISSLSEQISAAASQEDISALQEGIETLSTSAASQDDISGLQSSLGELAESTASAADLSALSGRLDEVAAEAGSLGSALSALQSDMASQITAAVASLPKTTSTASADPEPEGEPGFLPGQTAAFADGKLRVFLSRLDPDTGTARIAINGNVLQTMTAGSSQMLKAGREYCELGLDAVSASGAVINAVCGDELPAPEGLSAGSTALFEDGAARIFVSLVNEDSARLGLNGELTNVALGQSAPFAAGDQRCRAALDAVDRGHAQISVLCGDAVNVSEPISAGSTVSLGDGAARVFLAGIVNSEARFSVNGVDVQTGPAGHTVAVGEGCSVTLEDIGGGSASFSYACE